MFRDYEDEEWAMIRGYPSYEISNYGRVWSKLHNKLLAVQINKKGYVYVGLYQNGSRTTLYVHRLVGLAFSEGLVEESQINHLDGDKANNTLSNLEWVTPSQNIQHGMRTGLIQRSTKAGIPKRAVRIVETGDEFGSLSECAKVIDGYSSNIRHCLAGRATHHRGFTFEYVD